MKKHFSRSHWSSISSKKRWLLQGTLLLGAVGLSAVVYGQIRTQTSQLSVTVPGLVSRSTDVGPANPNQVLHVAVSLTPRDEAALQSFADSVSNPQSKFYQHYITPVQFGTMFGQPTAEVSKVTSFLTSHGFKLTLVSDSHLAVLADCTVAQAEAAFGTEIEMFHAEHPNKGDRADFYSFTRPLEAPSTIAPIIVDVSGLDNAAKPIIRARLGKAVKSMKALKKQGQAGQTLTPSQSRTLYNLAGIYNAGNSGAGRGIGISSFGGYRLSNLPLFYSQFGLPTPPGGVGANVTVVTVDGGAGTGTPNVEADLDIQMVLAQAPLCSLYIYDGGGGPVDVLTKEAQDNLSDVLTDSYGWALGLSDLVACHNAHLQMTTQGMTYMEATGDNGTQLEPFSYANIDPEVFQVGGTIATVQADGTRTAEVGWGGSGGGWVVDATPFNTLPPWQKGKGVPTNIPYRLNPDVAIHADGVLNGQDDSAYYFVFNGSVITVAGTSCASPTFAGALGDSEQKLISLNELPPNGAGKKRLGRISDLVYKQNGRSDVWHDITVGTNGTLPNGATGTAGPFWDFVTGWGSINWAGFVSAFSSNNPGNTVDASSVGIYASQGASPSGGIAQLNKVDQSYYSQAAIVNPTVGVVDAAVITFALPANPTSLQVNLVENGASGTTNFVYILNYTTSTYDLISTSANNGTDLTLSLAIASFSKYIGPGNKVSIVDRMVYPIRHGAVPYHMKLDLATLSVGS